MKKRVKRLTVFLLCMVCLFTIVGCEEKKENVLVVGTNATFPPFEYIANDGSITGFDADLMYAIGEEIGYEIQFTNMEFKSLLGAVNTGGVDAVIAGMTITEDRKQSVNFTDPYFSANQYMIVRIDTSLSQIRIRL